MERVFPYLRRYTAEKGYELNIADLHWGVPGVGIVDHSLPDLCMGLLEKWKTRRRLLTLVGCIKVNLSFDKTIGN